MRYYLATWTDAPCSVADVPGRILRKGRDREVHDGRERVLLLGFQGKEGHADRMRSEARFHPSSAQREGPGHRPGLRAFRSGPPEEAGGCHRDRVRRGHLRRGGRPGAWDRLRRARDPYDVRHAEEARSRLLGRGYKDLRRPGGCRLWRLRGPSERGVRRCGRPGDIRRIHVDVRGQQHNERAGQLRYRQASSSRDDPELARSRGRGGIGQKVRRGDRSACDSQYTPRLRLQGR